MGLGACGLAQVLASTSLASRLARRALVASPRSRLAALALPSELFRDGGVDCGECLPVEGLIAVGAANHGGAFVGHRCDCSANPTQTPPDRPSSRQFVAALFPPTPPKLLALRRCLPSLGDELLGTVGCGFPHFCPALLLCQCHALSSRCRDHPALANIGCRWC